LNPQLDDIENSDLATPFSAINALTRIRSSYPSLASSEKHVADGGRAAGAGDVVLAVSQSGTSVDPVLTLKEAKKNDASTTCITGNAQSPITQYADVTLLSVAREARIEAIASRLAQLSIADALYVIFELNNIETTTQNEKRTWDALLPKMY
jgi:DNA-binding MurR/RpiR family transcriptional regulator